MAEVIAVTRTRDVHVARRAARAIALAVGFDARMSAEVTRVVSDLVSNLVQHTRGGTVTLTPLHAGGRVGIQIESRDHGPGMADVEQALTSYGTSLGARTGPAAALGWRAQSLGLGGVPWLSRCVGHGDGATSVARPGQRQ